MMQLHSRFNKPTTLLSGLALCFLALFTGCSDEPKAPERFKLDPRAAAEAAVKLYDTNHDGTLDSKEIEQSPPMKELLKNLKFNKSSQGDGLSAADITGRFEQWLKGASILMSGSGRVFLDGKPLPDATVTFEPEPYLGSSYHAHSGQTDTNGTFDLDPELKDYPGIYVGLYRVRVSKVVNGKETIPDRYNAKSVLAREVAANLADSRADTSFQLKSR